MRSRTGDPAAANLGLRSCAPWSSPPVGRWGLAAYHKDEDRGRTEAAAANQCKQPYVITLGPTGRDLFRQVRGMSRYRLRHRVSLRKADAMAVDENGNQGIRSHGLTGDNRTSVGATTGYRWFVVATPVFSQAPTDALPPKGKSETL